MTASTIARHTVFPATLLLVALHAVMWFTLALDVALLPVTATVLALAVSLLAERTLPRRSVPPEPGERRADLTYLGLTSAVSQPLALALVGAAAVVVARWLPGVASNLPLWAGVIAVFAVGGLGDYWAHRWSHELPWWWRLHAVHHAPHRMVVLNNFRLHPVDLLLKVAFRTLPLLILGLPAAAIALAGAMQGVTLAFQHSNADLRHGWLNRIFSTNSVHRWHHSAVRSEADTNYGGMFSIFDQLFGTFRVPSEDEEPAAMGLFEERGYPVHRVVRGILAPWCWVRCHRAE